jgi:hypothetical protein
MGCIKLHILDEQYYRTELQVSYINKKLTSNFCTENLRSGMLVNQIDPDGRLDYRVHRQIMKTVAQGKGYSDKAIKQMVSGSGLRADFTRGTNLFAPITKYQDIHMDNKKNYSETVKAYNDAGDKFSSSLQSEKYKDVGDAGHTFGDFYSHSNYVDLYIDYVGEDNFDMSSMPTFNEVLNNPEQWSDFQEALMNPESGLKTGEYGKGTDKNASTHHKQMNLDKNKGKGAETVKNKDGTTKTKHEIAVELTRREHENRLK